MQVHSHTNIQFLPSRRAATPSSRGLIEKVVLLLKKKK